MVSSPSSSLAPIEQEILRTILYFDVFQHPLTAAEIVEFCSVPGISQERVEALCRTGALQPLLRHENGCYSIAASTTVTLSARRAKQRRAERLWPIARAMSRLIVQFPYVRGVFVSGELAKGVASDESDIDYVVITAEHRLWLCRTLLVLFKKTVLLNRKRYFCINHLQTMEHLDSAARSYYAAVEVATLRSMTGHDLRAAYLNANRWIADYLPNVEQGMPASHRPSDRSSFQSIVEFLIPSAVADRVDHWLLHLWQRVWERRYAHLSSNERSARFACTPYLSTAYGTDIANEVQEAWSRRLREYGS